MDMSKYKAMFISETTEHLQFMGQGLVKIEQDQNDKEAISEVFRNAHSIKGMAASMGYDSIRDLAHSMEDLMDDIREGSRTPEASSMDLLFKGLDILEIMVQEVDQDREPSTAGKDLSEKIRAFRNRTESPKKTPPPENDQDLDEDFSEASPDEIEEDLVESSAPEKAPPKLSPDDIAVDFGEEIEFTFKSSVPEGEVKKLESDKTEIETFETGDEDDFDLSMDDDDTFSDEHEEPAEPPPPAAPPTRAAPASVANRTVRVIFSAQTAAPGVRGLILLKRLGEVGEITGSRPSVDEIKAGRFLSDPKGLAVEVDLFAEAEEEEIINVINSMADLQSFELKAPHQEAAPPAAKEEEKPGRPAGQEAAKEPEGIEPDYDSFAQAQSLPQTVRVKTTDLDHFINALGEMILVKSELREVLKHNPLPSLVSGIDRLESLVRDFHDQVMSIRMMPLESVVQRLPRMVRELARDEGKKIRFEVKGQDIELDRAILEQLSDPLIHLLRNCVGHGIETPEERQKLGKSIEGKIELEAYRLRDLVLIDARDDGRGIDPFLVKEAAVAKNLISPEQASTLSDEDACQLIFAPGFSTAKEVGMVSGRGVGMDAVKTVVENLGGHTTVSSSLGKGTTFTLHLPRTIAIVNVLLIKLENEVFAVPITKILKTVEILPHHIRMSQGQRFYLERQELIPMKLLHLFLDLPEPKNNGRAPLTALIVETGKRKTALLVDELVGQEEAFIRPLGKPLERISGLSGVTMLGDGKVVFVLDTMSLI